MRIVITGADCAVGRGVAARLVSLANDVVGVGERRPESWPGSVVFITADVADAATLKHVLVDPAPDGLVVVPPSEVTAFLHPLDVD